MGASKNPVLLRASPDFKGLARASAEKYQLFEVPLKIKIMHNDTNIVSLLTQSFSQPTGGNPADLTDSTGRADFDQVLGTEFDRPGYEREFTPRESAGDRTSGDRTSGDRVTDDPSGVREKAHNDFTETPVRSDRPEQPVTPPPAQSEQAENRPAPLDDAPAGHSDKPVNNEPENPQTPSAANAAPAAESSEAEQGQAPVDEISNNLNASQQALRDRLEQLNIDPEIIDTLLESLIGNPQANGLLQSLYELLNAAGAAQAGAGAIANAGETQQAGLAENRVLQNLIKLGLSEADARQVIKQASAALAAKQTDSKNGPLLATLPQADGLKGNGTATAAEKLQSKSITQNLFFTQNNAETKPDSDSKNSSNANGNKLEKLASLLRTDANPNPLTQTTNPFKLAANPFLNVNGQTAAPLNVPGADGLALQAATTVDSAGKSVFKPVLAETYGQRGSVEKTVANQIIERISFRGMGSHKEINIKLDPPSLGSVRMNVSTTGESVRTTIVTENHFVKQVIESQLPQLRDSLANQGIKVDHFSVLVGGNSEQNRAHQQESASPTSYLGLENEDLQDTVEELVLTRGPVIFNESTINVFA